MTKIGESSTSPKTSGISSDSRSYRQMTHTRRPDGTSASIRNDPSRRSSSRITRLNAASTSSADRACAAIFRRFHSIHLNRLIFAPYRRANHQANAPRRLRALWPNLHLSRRPAAVLILWARRFGGIRTPGPTPILARNPLPVKTLPSFHGRRASPSGFSCLCYG